jgi:hypothetical protein
MLLKGKWIEYSDISDVCGRTRLFRYVRKVGFWGWFDGDENDKSHLLEITLRFRFQRDWSQVFKACEIKDFRHESIILTVDEKKAAINDFSVKFPDLAQYIYQTVLSF